MRAYGIARVSTGKQVKFGASLEMQEERIRVLAAAEKVEVIKIFVDEGVSGGETTKRAEYMKLKELVRLGQVDIIFTYHMSRYGRNFEELQSFWKLCEKKGVIIKHDQDDFDYRGTIGKLMRNIMGAMAEFIKDTASDTTSATLQNMKEAGNKYTNEPYGFKSVDGKLVPHEDEYAFAQLACDMRQLGRSLSSIAAHLNLSGIKPKRGSKWSHSQVASVIRTFTSLKDIVK